MCSKIRAPAAHGLHISVLVFPKSISLVDGELSLAMKLLNQRPLLVKLKLFYPEAIMTWLTVCSSVLVHNEISPIITYHGIFNMTMSDRAGATSGAGTSFPPGIPDFTSVFLGFALFNFFFYVEVWELLLISPIYGF